LNFVGPFPPLVIKEELETPDALWVTAHQRLLNRTVEVVPVFVEFEVAVPHLRPA